jgi:DNA polymerase III subunit chi
VPLATAFACSISLWRIILRVDFYHLTVSQPESVLPPVAEKLVSTGNRLLIVSDDDAQIERIDQMLWGFRADSFLPHGLSDEEASAIQPILLSKTTHAENNASNIALADGQWRGEALEFERVFYLFDDEKIEMARATWRALRETESLVRHFWKQDDLGKWREGP